MDQFNRLVGKILDIPEAADAIAAALDQEKGRLVEDLRNFVVRGNSVDAALCEGKLQALESVPSILTRFAKKASPAKQE